MKNIFINSLFYLATLVLAGCHEKHPTIGKAGDLESTSAGTDEARIEKERKAYQEERERLSKANQAKIESIKRIGQEEEARIDRALTSSLQGIKRKSQKEIATIESAHQEAMEKEDKEHQEIMGKLAKIRERMLEKWARREEAWSSGRVPDIAVEDIHTEYQEDLERLCREYPDRTESIRQFALLRQ